MSLSLYLFGFCTKCRNQCSLYNASHAHSSLPLCFISDTHNASHAHSCLPLCFISDRDKRIRIKCTPRIFTKRRWTSSVLIPINRICEEKVLSNMANHANKKSKPTLLRQLKKIWAYLALFSHDRMYSRVEITRIHKFNTLHLLK
jgi:hypothetical protein